MSVSNQPRVYLGNGKQKICLSMIVKNEASAIVPCLESVRPIIDCWAIFDTGSTDGTQDIIRNYLDDIPGELVERPWVNFAHNRSEALDLARQRGDYVFIIDADDVLELPPGFKMPLLNAAAYYLEIRHMELRYTRPQLLRSNLPWRYEGVLHEFLSCGRDKNNQRIFPENLNSQNLPKAIYRMTERGARRQVAPEQRYARDSALLENALSTAQDPFLVSRYTYYLAQSLQYAGQKEKALAAYLERAKLGFWDQEVFVSLYEAANLKAELGYDDDDVIQSFMRAKAVVASRAEALHGAARFCRARQRFQEGYDFAKLAMKIAKPTQGLFIKEWIYDYGVLDEHAVCAYWIGRYEECLKASRRILAGGKIPDEDRPRIQANVDFALAKLREAPVYNAAPQGKLPRHALHGRRLRR